MAGLNLDGDAAHDAAQRELGKPIYPRPSLTEQLLSWFDELLYKAFTNSSWLPGGWITVALLATVLIAAVVIAVRVARRTMGSARGTEAAVLGGAGRTAADHRAAAEQAAAQGDWANAIRHRLRAVARHLEETDTLDAVPGRTATELAAVAGAALPALAAELRTAADTFNAVSYGDLPGDEARYRQLAALDGHLRQAVAR